MKRISTLALVCTLGLSLSGCASAEPEPAPMISVTSQPAISPSDDADDGEYQPATTTSPAKNVPLPEFDEAITEVTEEGMEAAAKYYFDAVNYSIETGQSTAIDRIADESCEVCYAIFNEVRDIYDANSWVVGSGFRNYEFNTVLLKDDEGYYRVNFVVTEQPSLIADSVNSTSKLDVPSHMYGTIWFYFLEEHKQWKAGDFQATKTEKVSD